MSGNNKKIAVITGASSGIGRAFVHRIAKNRKKVFDEIWVIARRRELLNELVADYPELCIRAIKLDLSIEDSYDYLEDLFHKEEVKIGLLVNNAGFGRAGAFMDLSLKEQLGMIDVNVKGYTAVAHCALKYMKRNSIMINVASSAGFVPQPYFNVYAGTKAYALNLSRALKVELADSGIKVIAICPGPVETEFFDHAGSIEDYKKYFTVTADQVVEQAFKDIKMNREISVAGWKMKAAAAFLRILPAKLLLKGQKK